MSDLFEQEETEETEIVRNANSGSGRWSPVFPPLPPVKTKSSAQADDAQGGVHAVDHEGELAVRAGLDLEVLAGEIVGDGLAAFPDLAVVEPEAVAALPFGKAGASPAVSGSMALKRFAP